MTNTAEIPAVIVHNYLESFHKFLSRTGDKNTVWDRRFNGDQALFWLGRTKLIFSSAPVANFATLQKAWRYEGALNAAPEAPSFQLSRDILREKLLLDKLIDFAGPDKHIQMIPYANTPEFLELAATLRADHGITVDLPESPSPRNLWLGPYLDSKAGFRTLVSQLAPDSLPFGFLCENTETVVEALGWFRQNRKACVVKASQGGSGVGNLFLSLEELDASEDLNDLLRSNAYMREDLFIVEEQILSSRQLSPSLEFFVPDPRRGEPQITYLSDQLFEQSGRFAGVLISRELESGAWFAGFRQMGLKIAEHIQGMGFVGHFDLDAIVDDEDRLYLVEINARRTGGTFTHEFMLHNFGSDYLDDLAVLSENKLATNGIAQLDELEDAIAEVQYPMKGEPRGIIPMLTSMLPQGYLGYMALGDSLKEVQELRSRLIARLDGWG